MSESRGNNSGSSECTSLNCNCSKKVTVLQRRLKKYRAEAKYQKLWTKYVTEWLLYKFAFDVNLRIKLSKEKGDVPDSEEEDDDDEEEETEKEDNVNEMEQENVHQHHHPTPNVQVNNTTSSITSQQGKVQSKAKKRKIEESTTKISKPLPEKPDTFTVLSLGTKVPIKAEISNTLNRNKNYNTNNNNNNQDNNEGNFEENYDHVNDNLESTRNSMTITTTTTNSLPRVQIVHEEDPDIDIKYDPFAEFNAQNDDESEVDEDDKEQNEKDPFAELGDERNHLAMAKNLTPFEQQINEMESVWKTSTFNFQWVLDMKRNQTGVMPCTMFIKRDDVRQWFEYLPNKEKPELSRFRCRICYKYIREFGYPVKYHGPVEAQSGQLKKSETDNRNCINLHGLKQSHKEIILRLTNAMKKSGSSQNESELGVVMELTKQKRKQLLDTLEAS